METDIEKIKASTCVTKTAERDIDLCTAGASAQITYTPENSLGQYCYSYSFYQVRKKWLPSGKCNTEVSLPTQIEEFIPLLRY